MRNKIIGDDLELLGHLLLMAMDLFVSVVDLRFLKL